MTESSRRIPWYRKPGGILFVHCLRVIVCCYLLGPFAATLALEFKEPAQALPLAFLAGLAFGTLGVAGRRLPPDAAGRYAVPLFLCWVMLAGFFPFLILASLAGASLNALRFIPPVYVLGLLSGFIGAERFRSDRVPFPRTGWIWVGLILLFPLGHIGYGVHQDKLYAAQRGHGFERAGGFSSTDLKPYDPRVPGSITPRLEKASSFIIQGTESLPVLDGAEAAFPVYAAFAAACYPDLPPLDDAGLRAYDYRGLREDPLRFTNTVYAFKSLVEGDVDIFFGAQPSENQMRLAENKKKELVLTPIGKEAFVFFVNEENPVDGLASDRIRDIYSGSVRNWKDLGGGEAEIIAFQRPEGSGSQSVMLHFMGGTAMEEPLRDRYVGGMGGVVERTSEYRNAPSAIGYSFRFFLTGMGRQPRIKMLAVDGVMPTPKTIRSGEYPYVVNLYAVTVKDNPNREVARFLEWMQGDEGQELVEKTGYERVR